MRLALTVLLAAASLLSVAYAQGVTGSDKSSLFDAARSGDVTTLQRLAPAGTPLAQLTDCNVTVDVPLGVWTTYRSGECYTVLHAAAESAAVSVTHVPTLYSAFVSERTACMIHAFLQSMR